jgi:MoaA/NifB/PqqE/SkfB family radical SAM enzyme
VAACGDRDVRPSGFSDRCFSNADAVTIRRLAGGHAVIADELFRVIECLNGRTVGSFPNVASLYASLGNRTASDISPRSVDLLLDLFLDGVNDRLQSEIYQKHLLAQPPPPKASHAERIASLEATYTDAQAMVDSYDWGWLATWLQLKLIDLDAESCVRRLSNFAFRIRRVNFRFTYHCNIACRHCYNSSGPELKSQHIPLDTMLEVVAQMPDAGIGELNLTGGEPFLYLDHVTALIAAGRVAGLRGISLYTNGYWAATNERAEGMLERLSAAGFMLGPEDYIKVSTGIYHQEFVPIDRVLTLARAYHAMFGQRLRVDWEKAPGRADITEKAKQLVSEADVADKIQMSFRNVSALGRAKDLDGVAMHSIERPCSYIDQIVFDPDGRVRPCCGYNNENQGVTIGELKTHRLKDLVKRMQNDPVLQFLARNPMSAIFEQVDKLKNINGYSGSCHLCQDALGHLTNKEALQAKLFSSQQFYPFWFTLSRH